MGTLRSTEHAATRFYAEYCAFAETRTMIVHTSLLLRCADRHTSARTDVRALASFFDANHESPMDEHRRVLERIRIDIEGEDTRSWLSGQLTCDIRELQPGEAKSGLLLSSKGKIIADVHVLCESEHRFHLVLPSIAEAPVLARLERYLVMEDVDLLVSPARVVSVQGVGALEHLKDATTVAIWDVARLGTEGAECWLPAEEAAELLKALGGETSAALWEDARIAAGRPALHREMGENTLPQELGLFDAISFEKGCYIGQEPVVMLEHRGKPPKRLVLVEGSGLAENDELKASERLAGRICSVNSTGTRALALVRRSFLETPLHIDESTVAHTVIRHER